MSIQEVWNLKEKATDVDIWQFYSAFEIWITIIAVLLIFLVTVVQVFLDDSPLIGASFVILLSATAIIIINMEANEIDLVDKKLAKWEKDIAVPFINSLPVEQHEVIYIKIDPEVETQVSGSMTLGTGYIRSHNVKLTSMTITYKDGTDVITKTDWFNTNMVLTENERPYVEFQKLNWTLSSNLKYGNYNQTIYLPENYQFTDIK